MACDPNQLMVDAECFLCLTPNQSNAIIAFLLADGQTPEELMESSKCFQCLTTHQLLAIQTSLLCELVE